MVLKRQCSFCAGEVEPGTGTMFVKRDGSVFYFCSSTCRKQQLHLGRVGHRLKWTRAHAIKRAADQSVSASKRSQRPAAAPTPVAPAPAPAASAPTEPAPASPASAAAEKPKAAEPAATPEPAAAAPTKKPRARKPKTAEGAAKPTE